jgi:hypothetical protein
MRGSSSVYFNNFSSSGEQDLLHDLIIESISIYGQDMIYMPRQLTNYDKLLGEDDQLKYTKTFQIVTYIDSIDGFSGDGNFASKFGLEIRDQINLIIAQRTFSEEIGSQTGQIRPNEGDIIFFPLNKKCFIIRFVDKFSMFYQLGTLPTWKLTLELFEYSNEIFDTGYPEIDILQEKFSSNIIDWAILDENSDYLTDESENILVVEKYNIESINLFADNNVLQLGTSNFPDGSDDFIDFTEKDPFSEGIGI